MGGKLFANFLAAGLPMPQTIISGRVEGGPRLPIYDYYAGVAHSLLPVMERLGLASDFDVDDIADRLRAEAVASNACIIPPPLVGAWTQILP
jgi:hypothetical protein